MEDTYGNLISKQAEANDKKIVLLVMDGLGDCDNNRKGTALEIANTPNMDKLTKKSGLGLSIPVARGITPGSGPGHLGLFGYDPLIYQIGRGVLSALGIEFPLKTGDIAARLNFCTLDKEGNVADRRAGRISTDENKRVLQKIRENIKTEEEVELFLETVSEHRALLVLRGKNLDDKLGDTDPQETGVPPFKPNRPPYDNSKTASIVNHILDQVRNILKDEEKANMVLSRGFAQLPHWPSFEERYKLKPAAVAGYPMYRGVSRLLGIPIYSQPTSAEDICKETVKALDEDFTFIFSHFKYTDKTGEDGDIDAKAKVIEDMDKALPILLEKEPDALIITGDHSTPAAIASHSWHPVPTLIQAPFLRGPFMDEFNEKTCLKGEFGMFYAREMLPLAMAHTLKLQKFGA